MPLWLRSEQTADLSVEQLDENFTYLLELINSIGGDIPAPPYPSSILQSGLTLSFYLSDASLLGTATIPQVVVSYRGDWQPTTSYFVNDVVRVRGVGFFLISTNHTSAASFPGAGATYIFQYADQQVQLPLEITVSTLTLTRADHLNRLLKFTNVAGCDVTMDPDDWEDGDQVHAISRTAGSITFAGTSDIAVEPTDGFDAAVSTRGGAVTLIYSADESAMLLIGHLDPVSA